MEMWPPRPVAQRRSALTTEHSAACDMSIDEAVELVSREERQRNARRNLLMLRELLEVLDLFAEHSVPALPYKGPILAAVEYGNVSLRTFCDLDILVKTA